MAKSDPQDATHDPEQELRETIANRAEDDTNPNQVDAPAGSGPSEPTGVSQNIGRYEIVSELGAGGMGIVYLAKDPVLDRPVALKLPRFAPENRDDAVRRFYREARSMASVRHPNLCAIHDVGEIDDHPYLAMAYVTGPTLAEKLKTDGALDAPAAARIMQTAATAVHAIHEAGLVHRDLKPSNIMLDDELQPLITDFGLAADFQDDSAAVTGHGTLVGSPAYMAPEQIEGQRADIGPATDIYALGVILYELLCGRRPFSDSAVTMLGEIISGKPPVPLSQAADIDPSLDAICRRAMAFRIEDRFDTAQLFADSLGDWLDSAAAHTTADVSSGTRAAGFLWPAGLISLVVLAVTAAVVPWNSRDSADVKQNTTAPDPDQASAAVPPRTLLSPAAGVKFRRTAEISSTTSTLPTSSTIR